MNDVNNDRYLSVIGLTRYIKRQFTRDAILNDLWVRGEISNFNHHSRGHMYFTLKDEHSRIQSVMFAGHNRTLSFQPENGMKVLIRGEVNVYEPFGQYQLYAKEMQPDGIGNLFLAFEKLKETLEKEGLFAEHRKRELPKFPTEIGVITSPSGAAVRDIVTTVKRRFPIARITLFPVTVQGDRASVSISKAIAQANELNMHDVLIVGRGGGSLEDLWAFNEEIVARNIFHSTIPIISAVGHETDFTISDFVADVRAATPTAAAELAVPNTTELHDRIENRKIRLIRAMLIRLEREKERLEQAEKSYAFRYPMQLVQQKHQDLDYNVERIIRAMKRQLERKRDKWNYVTELIHRVHPRDSLNEAGENRTELTNRLVRAMKEQLNNNNATFQKNIAHLQALSPLNIMQRGYSIIKKEEDIIKSISQVELGDFVQLELQDGQLDCHVWGMEEVTNGRSGTGKKENI